MSPVQTSLTIVALVVLSVSCSKQLVAISSPTPSPSPAIAPSPTPTSSPNTEIVESVLPVTPLWSFQLFSNCFYGVLDECIAGYGFSVDQFGNYRIGPGPQKQTYIGRLEDHEFQLIQELTLLAPLSKPPTYGHDTCLTSYPIGVTQTGEIFDSALAFDPRFCFRSLPVAKAVILFEQLRRLAIKYYPLPFPSYSCETVVSKLNLFFYAMQGCTRDSDCTYVEKHFRPVHRASASAIVVDDCSVVKPLLIANERLLLHYELQLYMAELNALAVCEKEKSSMNCKPSLRLQQTYPPPICREGYCSSSFFP